MHAGIVASPEESTGFLFDWGGFFGLRLAAEEPHYFARLVCLNTQLPTGDPSPGHKWFRDWRKAQASRERTKPQPKRDRENKLLIANFEDQQMIDVGKFHLNIAGNCIADLISCQFFKLITLKTLDLHQPETIYAGSVPSAILA